MRPIVFLIAAISALGVGCSYAPPKTIYTFMIEPDFGLDEQAAIERGADKWIGPVQSAGMDLRVLVGDCSQYESRLHGEVVVCTERAAAHVLGGCAGVATIGEHESIALDAEVITDLSNPNRQVINLAVLEHTMQHEMGHVFGLSHLQAGTVMFGVVYPEAVQGTGRASCTADELAHAGCDAASQDLSQGDIAAFDKLYGLSGSEGIVLPPKPTLPEAQMGAERALPQLCVAQGPFAECLVDGDCCLTGQHCMQWSDVPSPGGRCMPSCTDDAQCTSGHCSNAGTLGRVCLPS